MIPIHVALADLLAEVRHLEGTKFMILGQGDHGGCAPIADRIEIDAEVALPTPCHGVGLVFARTEGEPNAAIARLRLNLSDVERMGEAGTHGLSGGQNDLLSSGERYQF